VAAAAVAAAAAEVESLVAAGAESEAGGMGLDQLGLELGLAGQPAPVALLDPAARALAHYGLRIADSSRRGPQKGKAWQRGHSTAEDEALMERIFESGAGTAEDHYFPNMLNTPIPSPYAIAKEVGCGGGDKGGGGGAGGAGAAEAAEVSVEAVVPGAGAMGDANDDTDNAGGFDV
jgi:hypothetical protein